MTLVNTFFRAIFGAIVLTAIMFSLVSFAEAQSADPVSEVDPVTVVLPAVLGASTSNSADPVFGESVLGVSADEAVDPVDPTMVVETELPPSTNTKTVTAVLNVRLSPSVLTDKVGQVTPGMVATVVGVPIVFSDYTWHQVTFDSGLAGWVAGEWLE